MSVTRSSFWFALGTLLSRLTGLLREAVIGGVFGASALLDAFIVAFRIPNLFREMLAEGALASSFTKVFSSETEKSRQSALQLMLDALVFFSLAAAIFCSLGVIFAPELVGLMSLQVGAGEKTFFTQNAIALTQILFPYLGLTVISSIVMGALHERGSFFLSAVSPTVFNFGYILGAWLLADWLEQWNPDWISWLQADPRGIGLAIGVLAGGIGQFLMQTSVLLKPVRQYWPELRLRFKLSQELKQVLRLMGPAAIAAGAGPINVFVNTNFATALGDGAVSWLNFAFRILQLPIGLFGVAIGVAVLPSLSKSLKRSELHVTQDVNRQMMQALELVIWIMALCSLLMVSLRLEMVQLLYQHGKFSLADAEATASALQAYSFGVVAYGLIKVLSSFYYAVEKTSFAMKVAIFSIAVNFIGNYYLVDIFGHVGLAATSSITLSFNALVLLSGIFLYGVRLPGSIVLRSFLHLLLGVLLAAAFCYGAKYQLGIWLASTPVKIQAFLILAVCGSGSVVIFGAIFLRSARVGPKALARRLLSRRS